jgi:hypothetical protein
VAHACFNLLEVPVFTDKAVCRQRLLMSIQGVDTAEFDLV